MDRRGRIEESGVSPSRAERGRRLPRALRMSAVTTLLAAVLANSACYHYVAVSPETVASDEDVQVRITKAAAGRLAGELGTFSTELDGKLSVRGSDSLAVAVPISREYQGVALDTTAQFLTLARSEVVDVRRSEISRGRTILTAAGVVVGFALLVSAIQQLTNPNPGTDETLPPPPPPTGSRAPSGHRVGIRIPFP